MIITKHFALVALPVLLAGCVDPLTRSLKSYNYAPIKAPSTGDSLADIYRDPARSRAVVKLRQELGDRYVNDHVMNHPEIVSLQDSSGSASYNLDVKADVIGYVAAELQAKGARKFSIAFGAARRYQLSDREWLNLQPDIRRALGPLPFTDQYAVTDLLQVDSLTYTLETESGGQVNLEPSGEISEIVKAKLGLAWTVTRDGKLLFTEPRFIGYRVAQINGEGNLREFKRGASSEPVLRRLSRAEMTAIQNQ